MKMTTQTTNRLTWLLLVIVLLIVAKGLHLAASTSVVTPEPEGDFVSMEDASGISDKITHDIAEVAIADYSTKIDIELLEARIGEFYKIYNDTESRQGRFIGGYGADYAKDFANHERLKDYVHEDLVVVDKATVGKSGYDLVTCTQDILPEPVIEISEILEDAVVVHVFSSAEGVGHVVASPKITISTIGNPLIKKIDCTYWNH